jgi:endogenous inhibitor of DNA gyrase (YacG/DUF329 family)
MNCPICDKPADKAVRPFCSRRCADVDLSRWLKGSYAIPGAPAGEDDESGLNPHENIDPKGPDKGMDRE